MYIGMYVCMLMREYVESTPQDAQMQTFGYVFVCVCMLICINVGM
jgi:hypothetical protein